MDLWDAAPVRLESNLAASPLEALKFAVCRGDVSLPEALVTIIQLMVNMTSANALGNMVLRLCTEDRPRDDDESLDAFINEVLRLDAPLQRNPRRVLQKVK